MERRFDQRLKDQIGNSHLAGEFHPGQLWQATCSKCKIGENYNVFNEFRMTVNRSMEDAMQATHENNLYAKREFHR